MTAGVLVVRAEAGPAQGAGHVARCFALAQAWRDRGGRAVLVSGSVPDLWRGRLHAGSIEVRSPDDPGVPHAAWAVVDGYEFDATERRRWRDASEQLLIVDDHAAAGEWDADLVLDQNLGATADAYGSPAIRPHLLLGPRYALLRREFRARVHVVRDGQATRVALSAGGWPTPAVRARFDAIADGLAAAGLEVVLLEDVDDVAAVLGSVDLAVSAAGGTAWELCALGVPSVLVPVADNQRPVAAHLVEAGAARAAAPGPDEATGVLTAVRTLVAQPDQRAELGRRARQLVDGLGAIRVVTRMVAATLSLRRVAQEDAHLLWQWANDAATRAQSFQTEPIGWDEHRGWLEARLADPDHALFIGSDEHGPIGNVRFAPCDRGVEISVVVAPHRRGAQLAAPLIEAGVERAFAELATDRVVARVKADNQASQRAFMAADFDLDERGSAEATGWHGYTRARHAAE